MSKIIIAADIHFGIPGRLDDLLWSCKVMRKYADIASIDTIIILGDLFHSRKSIEWDILHHVSEFFIQTKNNYNQNWIIFPGNHDMFLKHSWDITSLTSLRECTTIIGDVKLLEIDDARFWILPFIMYERAYINVVKRIEEQATEDDHLLTHIGINGAMYNTCFLHKDWNVINFEETSFKRIYAGHFHNKQQIGENIWYPGSPIPFKFDEGDIPHGFYVYDLEEQSHKFINIWKAGQKFYPDSVPPPQFCTILDESLNSITEDDVKNNIIRVALQKEHTIDEKNEIKKLLLEFGAKIVRWWDISEKLNKDEEAETIVPENKDLFHAFFESDKKTDGLNKEIMYKTHDEVINEGDRAYTIETDLE